MNENHNNDRQIQGRKHRNRVTNTEVDNRVHPLHWAMSPGPSPMGTDPINGFKWYKMVLASASAFAETECWIGSLQDLLSGNYNLVFKRQRSQTIIEKWSNSKYKHHSG